MVEDNETTDSLEPDFLDATPAGANANSYTTVLRMYELMKGVSSKLSEKWNALEEEDRARVLIEGTRLIDQFRNWGVPYSATQALAFPRKIDTRKVEGVRTPVIDARVERALLEYAKHRCDGKMIAVKRMQAEGISSQSIGGQSSSQRPDITELPAGTKRELLRIARSYWTSAKSNRSYGHRGDRHTQADGSLFG